MQFQQWTRRVGAVEAFVALLCLGWGASSASATFHEMSIREVFPGSALHPGSEYVELQMWSPGQNLVEGHTLKTYNATGGTTGTTTFAKDVPRGSNQSTILLASAEAETEFGVAPDTTMSAGLDPSGGAVCWESLDCVSWGSFSGSLPSPAGSPAAAISDGMALRRTIAPGCATLLEPTDDHDNSAADFSAVFPAPRPNSVAPTEKACASSGGPLGGGPNGGDQGGGGPPQTTLKRKPPHKTHDRTPTFRFAADEPGSSFQCKLDGKKFRACRSPLTTKQLSLGPHTFKVRARDESGRLDPSPASCAFRVLAGAS